MITFKGILVLIRIPDLHSDTDDIRENKHDKLKMNESPLIIFPSKLGLCYSPLNLMDSRNYSFNLIW